MRKYANHALALVLGLALALAGAAGAAVVTGYLSFDKASGIVSVYGATGYKPVCRVNGLSCMGAYYTSSQPCDVTDNVVCISKGSGSIQLDPSIPVTPALFGGDTSATSDEAAPDATMALRKAIATGRPVKWHGILKVSDTITLTKPGQILEADTQSRLVTTAAGDASHPVIQIGDGTHTLYNMQLRGEFVVWSTVDRATGAPTVRADNCNICKLEAQIGSQPDEQVNHHRRLADGWAIHNSSVVDVIGDIWGFRGEGLKVWADSPRAEFHYSGLIMGGDTTATEAFGRVCAHVGGGMGGVRFLHGGASQCQIGYLIDTELAGNFQPLTVDTTAGSNVVHIVSGDMTRITPYQALYDTTGTTTALGASTVVTSIDIANRNVTTILPLASTSTNLAAYAAGTPNREISIEHDASPDSSMNRDILVKPVSFSYMQLNDLFGGGGGIATPVGANLPAGWGTYLEVQYPQTAGQDWVNISGTQVTSNQNDAIVIGDGRVTAHGLNTRLSVGHGVHLLATARQGFDCDGCDFRDAGTDYAGRRANLSSCGFKADAGSDNFSILGGSVSGSTGGGICLSESLGPTRLVKNVRGFQTESYFGMRFEAGTPPGSHRMTTRLACAPKRVIYSMSSGPASGAVPIVGWSAGKGADATSVSFTTPATMASPETFDVFATCYDQP